MNELKTISYEGQKVFVGIDVHRREYVVSCVCDGVLVKRCRMGASFERLLSFLGKHFQGAELLVGYEAGFSGFILQRFLESNGVKCLVVNPSSIEVASRDRVKTDKRDSLKIAVQLSTGQLKGIRVPSLRQESERLIHRSREQLIKERTRLKNQIRFKLHQFGLLSVDYKSCLGKAVVQRIIASEIPRELVLVLSSFLVLWESVEEQIRELDVELKRQASTSQLEALYCSVSGVGPITARTLESELGDMSQFANQKALFSYAGLTPSENSSGNTRRLGHISHQGNARLRRVLTECSWVAISKDAGLAADFKRIAVRAGKKKAIVAIARKLLGRIRAVVRTKQEYDSNYCLAA